MTDVRTKKLEQVRMLLEKASSTPYTEEADALRKKADDLMLSYTIEQWEVDQKKPKYERAKPILRQFSVVTTRGSVLRTQLVDLFTTVCRHVDARPVYYGLSSSKNKGPVSARVVGFEADLEYVEMLFTSLSMQMAAKVNPGKDPMKTRAENVYAMKAGGMKWKDIFRILELPFVDENGKPTRERSAVFSEYKRYCRDNNLEEIGTNPETYVRNFADGFVTTVAIRLADIRRSQKEESAVTGSGMELALRDRAEDVNAKLKEEFPTLGTAKMNRSGKYDPKAYGRGSDAGRHADLGSKKLSGARKEIG